MTKEDWVSCKVPVLMADAIDAFLKTDIAKKNGIFSRTDFLSAVIRKWFAEHDDILELGKKKDFKIFMTIGDGNGKANDKKEIMSENPTVRQELEELREIVKQAMDYIKETRLKRLDKK